MGSAQAVDDASAMITNAAEASITRCKIGGIFRRLLWLVNYCTVRVLIRQDLQDLHDLSCESCNPEKSCLKAVIFDFVEESLVADAQILGSFALVAVVRLERLEDFPALDEVEGAVSHVGECSRKIEFFQCLVRVSARWHQPEIARLKYETIRDDARTLDCILKLTHVPGPVMLLQRHDRLIA